MHASELRLAMLYTQFGQGPMYFRLLSQPIGYLKALGRKIRLVS